MAGGSFCAIECLGCEIVVLSNFDILYLNLLCENDLMFMYVLTKKNYATADEGKYT